MVGRLAAEILGTEGLEELSRNSLLSRRLRSYGVVRSEDFRRIEALPRRTLALDDIVLARAVTKLLSGRDNSLLQVRPRQAAMLVEATEHQGLLDTTPVGGGKSWLAPLFVTDKARKEPWPQLVCDRPVLLTTPGLVAEMRNTVIPNLSTTFTLHPNLQIVPYSRLQQKDGESFLHKLAPDVVIADELHCLKWKQSARTKRVLRWMQENPRTRFVGMSGTITDRSLRDFWHMLQWTHPLDSPLPYGWKELEDWALAVDADVPDEQRLDAGALEALCAPGESTRQGLRRRMVETHGFIGATEGAFGGSLIITAKRDVKLNDKAKSALRELRDAWLLPSGEEVPDAPSYWRHCRELALGFYYEWAWPNGKRDVLWLEARAEWQRIVREVLKRGLEEKDTELLVRNACVRGELPKSLQLRATQALEAWDIEKQKPAPPTVAKWLCSAPIDYALDWADEAPGIVWFEHKAIGAVLMRRELKTFGDGDHEELRQLSESPRAGTMPIACSMAHATGKNLQAWSRNLLTSATPSSKRFEQLTGRTHRPGQKADEVTVDFLAHEFEAMSAMHRAVKRAQYAEGMTGAQQKILLGTCIGWTRDV